MADTDAADAPLFQIEDLRVAPAGQPGTDILNGVSLTVAAGTRAPSTVVACVTLPCLGSRRPASPPSVAPPTWPACARNASTS